jgi:hypothetical protein
VDNPKDVVINVTGVSAFVETNLEAEDDNKGTPREDQVGTSEKKKPASD